MRFRWIVVATAIVLMVAGISQLYHMPVDVFPEFAPPQVEIQTPSAGLFPEEVEALVTVPLEEAMAGLPRLHVMRSKSVAQLSSIMLEFERGLILPKHASWCRSGLPSSCLRFQLGQVLPSCCPHCRQADGS